MMWSRLSAPWKACIEMAWEAFCAGCIPIGSVITDADGNLVAAGRNRIGHPRAIGPLHLSGLPLAHAEINALLALDYNKVNARECTLYTTTEPCPQCAGALVMCNIRHFCYASRDPWAGSANLFSLSPYMSSKHTRIEGPTDTFLENILAALQAEFFLRESQARGRSKSFGPVLDAYAKITPEGVALGERLHREHTLQAMQEDHLSTGEVIDLLAGMLQKQNPRPLDHLVLETE